ncbi:MAG: Ig-like domain-containing protein, partial [Myxococcota bacterium]
DEVEVASCAFTEPAVLGAIAPVFSEDKKECRLSYELNTSALPEAPLLIAVTATDATGNEASASLAGVVDNSLPTLTVTSPTADEVVTGVVTILATAADPSGIASLELVSLPGLIDIAPASDRLEVQWDTTTQFDGPLELEFLAIDENGLETTRKVQVEVDNIESTTISGVVSFVTPVNEASVTLYTYEGQVRGDEPLGKAVTDANGEFRLIIENPYSGVVLLAAVGGEFVDAASGQTMALGRELLVPITDLVAGDAYRKHLDPWSTLAVGRALADTTLPADVALDAALENVGLHLRRPEAIALCDTEVIDVTAGPASVGDAGTILGLASAALSRQAANLSV